MLLGQGANPKWRVIYFINGREMRTGAMNKATARGYLSIFNDAIAIEKFKGLFQRRIMKRKKS